jgi:hypothetical protein
VKAGAIWIAHTSEEVPQKEIHPHDDTNQANSVNHALIYNNVSIMPPFVADSDSISLSFSEDEFDQKPIIALHHENNITTESRRSVSFAPVASTHNVMGLGNYTPEERNASFFEPSDMLRMKFTAKSEARLLDSGLLVEEKKRGLEAKTRLGAQQKRFNRMGAYAAVFMEIEFQKEEQILDEDSIATAYSEYTYKCAISARKIGEQDAREALDIYTHSFD